MKHPIRVLVVDDSAFVRKVVREMLARSPFIEVVGAACDGEEALELVQRLQPDVVTCDLIMPRLDGVGFVRRQMARRPLPIVIMSVASENGALALDAVDAGAVDFVRKPTALATDKIFEVSADLVEKVKMAARAALREPPASRTVPLHVGTRKQRRMDLVVIGVSTGGPQALRFLLPQFPADFPVPIVLVMHMPPGYTELFAQRTDPLCAIEVAEAAEGVELRPGLALVARAGHHLVLRRDTAGRVTAHLDLMPVNLPHRPAVDVLFRSAAELYGERVLGVVMTGMGSDGTEGAGWIRARGGTVLTEAEDSCVVYGMPRSVVEAGVSDAVVPLSELAAAIMTRI